jgi:hypothetical protein
MSLIPQTLNNHWTSSVCNRWPDIPLLIFTFLWLNSSPSVFQYLDKHWLQYPCQCEKYTLGNQLHTSPTLGQFVPKGIQWFVLQLRVPVYTGFASKSGDFATLLLLVRQHWGVFCFQCIELLNRLNLNWKNLNSFTNALCSYVLKLNKWKHLIFMTFF